MTKLESDVEIFDLLVLGSGEAGKYIAWTMAGAGRKAALIERRYIGGSCPNIACLPSKNVIYSAEVAHLLSDAARFGVRGLVSPVDMEAVRERKRAMVAGLVKMHEDRFAQTGVELVCGEGRFTAPQTIEVSLTDGGKRMLSGRTIVISTGSRPAVPDIPGLSEAEPLTHIEALELSAVPEHLIILGGGFVGLEFAQAMRRFGSQVSVLERGERLLMREDEDVSNELAGVLLDEGINLLTGARLRSVAGKSGEGIELRVERDGKIEALKGSHLMVATGRIPNTDRIGLDLAGVGITAGGFIKVNDHLETTAPGVFAVGDCAGSPQFTHAAFDDFRIVCDHLSGGGRSAAVRSIPSCLFVDPEYARIGMSEEEARNRGIQYRLLKLPMGAVLRTRTTGDTKGFLKALIGADDRILGFMAIGSAAGELMSTVQLAMSAGLPYSALGNSIFAHPTYSEGLVSLFSAKPVEGGR